MPEQLPQVPSHSVPIQPLFGDADEQPLNVPPAGYPQAYSQPVYPVVAPPPVATPTAAAGSAVAATAPAASAIPGASLPTITLVSHSSLFYWWPVWAVGYICALLTYLNGQTVQVGNSAINIHPSNNLGVLFFMTLFVVIMISNVIVRGLASAVVIMAVITLTVIFAYFGWWDPILNWVGELTIYLNQGAYFWFATLMFLVWTFTTFVFDRMTYWRVEPGQLTHVAVFGSSSRSYDAENMSFEKHRNDVFRHWLLGMGSGDLTVNAFNAGKPEELHIPNILFIGMKIRGIQQLIAMKSTDAAPPVHH